MTRLKFRQGLHEGVKTEIRFSFRAVETVEKGGQINQLGARFEIIKVQQLATVHDADIISIQHDDHKGTIAHPQTNSDTNALSFPLTIR